MRWTRTADPLPCQWAITGAVAGAPTRVPVKESCAERSRKIKQKLIEFWVEAASCLRQTHQEMWGASPPTFPDGLPGGRRPLRTLKRRILAFVFRLPSAKLPFKGTRPTSTAAAAAIAFAVCPARLQHCAVVQPPCVEHHGTAGREQHALLPTALKDPPGSGPESAQNFRIPA